jgi:hypothetical protein
LAEELERIVVGEIKGTGMNGINLTRNLFCQQLLM